VVKVSVDVEIDTHTHKHTQTHTHTHTYQFAVLQPHSIQLRAQVHERCRDLTQNTKNTEECTALFICEQTPIFVSVYSQKVDFKSALVGACD
jgi:hypothetical protein